MALTDFNAFKAMIKDSLTLPPQKVTGMTNNLGTGAATHTFLSLFTQIGGVAPTTAVVPNDTTVGAWPKKPATGNLYLTRAAEQNSDNYDTMYLLVDRVSHQGGIDSSVTPGTPLTTNLPTATLTRYTSGVGIYAALMGNLADNTPIASQVTISYTNSANTAGRTGLFQFPTSQIYGRIADPFCLAAGDDGVKSVESITFPTSYGAGMGICLYKPIAFFMSRFNGIPITAENLVGWNTPIHTNACLDLWMVRVPGFTHLPPSTASSYLQLSFGEV